MTAVTANDLRFPDSRALVVGLSSVLAGEPAGTGVVLLDRRPNDEASSFPSEIVYCRVDGAEVELLCKYSADFDHGVYGHRRGVGYEAEVYRHVVEPSGQSAPCFFGAHTDPATGETWLVTEYVAGAVRVNRASDPAAIVAAASWFGRFHGTAEALLARPQSGFLTRYDAAYYAGWTRRTAEFAGAWHERLPWLGAVCGKAEGLLQTLLVPPTTIVHGECYPRNVLYRDGRIYPIDWESAAVAAGEIDLAALTEGWPAETVDACVRAYGRARWPAGAPTDLSHRLDVARLYLLFRWFGDRPEWTAPEGFGWRFEQLRATCERLGLLS